MVWTADGRPMVFFYTAKYVCSMVEVRWKPFQTVVQHTVHRHILEENSESIVVLFSIYYLNNQYFSSFFLLQFYHLQLNSLGKYLPVLKVMLLDKSDPQIRTHFQSRTNSSKLKQTRIRSIIVQTHRSLTFTNASLLSCSSKNRCIVWTSLIVRAKRTKEDCLNKKNFYFNTF